MIGVPPSWLTKFADWLTSRRIRTQAVILAVCLWSAAIVDFSKPGFLDRAGNIKFQDFLQFYIAGKLVDEHRTNELFDPHTEIFETEKILGQPTPIQLPTVYGPQVATVFVWFSRIQFFPAASIATAIGGIIFVWGCLWFLRFCPTLRPRGSLVVPAILAFPPFFHFAVRGQISYLIFLSFILAYLAFRNSHEWLAGLALALAVFKPQFLLGIGIVLIATCTWKAVVGILLGALIQLGGAWLEFGTAVMRAYLNVLWHLPSMAEHLEPGVAPSQMHSLRSFWTLILPWPPVSGAFYVVSSLAVLYIATKAWKSSGPLELRFSVLILGAVLVNPHLFIYDLLALAPMFFLVIDWVLQHHEHPWSQGMKVLLYFAFLLPLFGPMAIWTHLQLSVVAFVGLLIVLASVLNSESRQFV